ncbi:FAD-dependent oxidoreductase [Mariniblastus sp.]|nr:FAD-dependent oxidoreductase [Mariniblastus sp.]MDB4756591.1 FAD-dependent oxidoreductase [Mariniblastus sp.]
MASSNILLESLPAHLHQRMGGELPHLEAESGDFVLYWMQTAMRADENPALDLAMFLADFLKLPLLVFQGLSGRDRYGSDRHHTFVLEGARDVQNAFQEQGISYAFYLEQENRAEKPILQGLARTARVVVTEEMPVNPYLRSAISLDRNVATPLIKVDTACILPMREVGKTFDRAFEFRQRHGQDQVNRAGRPWPETKSEPRPFNLGQLHFPHNLFLQDTIENLVAGCEIDHSVGPIPDSPGGFRSGYRRWLRFKDHHLNQYASKRGNPLSKGVSRMSAYLHYGMVSPFRIAREASQSDSSGAKKFLDELLVWRELAYNFCFHQRDHARLQGLPEWAIKTLKEHSPDHRPLTFNWEDLARANSGDPLWDICQRSLLRQGELHNSLRMTWGKKFLEWTASPKLALKLMIDLNNRYALDGRDPCSYGGILWCLGLFDRPHDPEIPIFGTLRPRSTKTDRKTLDLAKLSERIAKPRIQSKPSIAIVGAGLSGLFAARTLSDHGLSVTIFEKSRGTGGRMSTRRVDNQPRFDHGAQYFTVKNPHFRRYVQSWIQQGIVARWGSSCREDPLDRQSGIVTLSQQGKSITPSNSVVRYVATPGMNSICKHLSTNLNLKTQTQVSQIVRRPDGLELIDANQNSLGEFDRVILSTPPPQAVEILKNFPLFAKQISDIRMNPCWAIMASFPQPITTHWAGAFIHDSFITWACRNSTKAQRRTSLEDVVIHADSQWTELNWDRDPAAVGLDMLQEFWRATGLQQLEPLHLSAHRWKYAFPANPASIPSFFDRNSGIVACGDWCNGPRVEGAFLSGMSAAGRILGELSAPQPKQFQLFE